MRDGQRASNLRIEMPGYDQREDGAVDGSLIRKFGSLSLIQDIDALNSPNLVDLVALFIQCVIFPVCCILECIYPRILLFITNSYRYWTKN